VLTAVISAAPGAAAVSEADVGRFCVGVAAGGFVTSGAIDDAVSLGVDDADESDRAPFRTLTAGFGGGNSSWEIAITMSDRNRARKKRLSIQGTGS
jgi:hypothetical protein